MKKLILAICLFWAQGVFAELIPTQKTPQCDDSAVIEAWYDEYMQESGDGQMADSDFKVLGIDKENGIITCQAKLKMTYIDMPYENNERFIKYTLRYGIEVKILDW